MIPILIAAAAAGGILLIVIGLTSTAPVDPVQARLTQLGTMQAKNLEEMELQSPFLERTLRPLAARLSGSVARVTSASFAATTQKRLALAGNPGDLRVADWLGIKALGGILGVVIFALLGIFALGTGVLFGIIPAIASATSRTCSPHLDSVDFQRTNHQVCRTMRWKH